jgi:protein-S-isoprenylcysteine O-methyltransferase Ste14
MLAAHRDFPKTDRPGTAHGWRPARGWVLVVVSSFLINHFELFGLQQVYLNFRNRSVPEPLFTDRWLYKLVRHPLQLGILRGIWATPNMSMTHLCLALTMTRKKISLSFWANLMKITEPGCLRCCSYPGQRVD